MDQRACWEDIVTSHVNATPSAGLRELRALFAQPYVLLRDLEQKAEKVGIDKDQLHRALQFLHATGSMLHYGSCTRQHSQMLQKWVFTQPQFVIDVIKYVIRESKGEDVDDELRAMDDRIRGTALGKDLDLFLNTGELTQSLLAGLWAKFKFKEYDLMLELMKGFKLLRELGNNGEDKHYVIPAMLPTGNLPNDFLAPLFFLGASLLSWRRTGGAHPKPTPLPGSKRTASTGQQRSVSCTKCSVGSFPLGSWAS
jgi:hypothetical protein